MSNRPNSLASLLQYDSHECGRWCTLRLPSRGAFPRAGWEQNSKKTRARPHVVPANYSAYYSELKYADISDPRYATPETRVCLSGGEHSFCCAPHGPGSASSAPCSTRRPTRSVGSEGSIADHAEARVSLDSSWMRTMSRNSDEAMRTMSRPSSVSSTVCTLSANSNGLKYGPNVRPRSVGSVGSGLS
eukprot:SAG31_NODE_5490_length_2504_cov_1.607069_2_plen_188_part_00